MSREFSILICRKSRESNSEREIRSTISTSSYSIRIVDPLRFYAEAVPRNASRVEIEDINEQYMNEFLEGLQSSINQMAADGIRISFAASKSAELSRYMADAMDESWRAMRGMEIQSVAIASLSYDDPDAQRRCDDV